MASSTTKTSRNIHHPAQSIVSFKQQKSASKVMVNDPFKWQHHPKSHGFNPMFLAEKSSQESPFFRIGILLFFLGFPNTFHDFPRVFPGFSHGFPIFVMVFPWFSHGKRPHFPWEFQPSSFATRPRARPAATHPPPPGLKKYQVG